MGPLQIVAHHDARRLKSGPQHKPPRLTPCTIVSPTTSLFLSDLVISSWKFPRSHYLTRFIVLQWGADGPDPIPSRSCIAVYRPGDTLAFPLGIAPMSMQRMAHPDGELAVAGAAAEVGVPMVTKPCSQHSMQKTSEHLFWIRRNLAYTLEFACMPWANLLP